MRSQRSEFLKTARGETTTRTPVWLMRQAGRILPEYRAVREKVKDFKQLVETPELACEVTIQPVDILGVDAAIIFSDILVIPEAMGLPYKMVEAKGPLFEETVNSVNDINKLKVANPLEDLKYVIDAINLTKSELNNRVPLLGFAGAPWTILAYMIEGQGSKTFSKARRFLYTKPEAANQLLQKITESTIAYLKAQIAAGADAVQIFDSWAGILSPQLYRLYGLPYLRMICDAITETPVIVFAKGAHFALPEIANLNCEVIGLDWNMHIEETRKLTEGKTLQGNMDPCLLYADGEIIERETKNMLKAFGPKKHIANLGHGVYPDTPLDNVKRFVDTVKQYRFE